MIRYFIIRLSRVVLLVFIASFVIFYLLHQLQGDPALMQLGIDADLDAIEQRRAELGLDQPILIQFFQWLASLLAGTGGESFFYGFDSLNLVGRALGVTFPLTMASIFAASIGGLFIGGVMAYAPRNLISRVLAFLAQIIIAIPSFWLGIALLMLVSVKFGWLQAGNFPGWDISWQLSLQSLVLPTIALALPIAAIIALLFRATSFTILRLDFIRTARAKGASKLGVWWHHVLRHCAIPIITFIALYSAMLLMGAVIVETVFHLPGLGKLLLQALHNRDYPLLQTGLIMILVIVMLIQIITDLLLAWVDPRLHYEQDQEFLPYQLQA